MEKDALEAARDLLNRRDYSSAGLARKLKQKGYAEEEIRGAVERFVELGAVRDEQFARSRLRTFLRRGYSAQLALRKVRLEGIPAEDAWADEALSEIGSTPEEQVDAVIRSKARPGSRLSQKKLEERILRHLRSKGHPFDFSIARIRLHFGGAVSGDSQDPF